MMKCLMLAFVVATVSPFFATATFAHPGGCRKSSPPGQCCHMDNRAGRVHCR